MKLTGQPYKKTVPNGRTGRGSRAHSRWVLPTDEGEILSCDAAKRLGMTQSAFTTRVNRVVSGIISPDKLFAPRNEPQAKRKVVDNRIVTDEFCAVPDEDIGKYAHLSARVRERNMWKIPAMGTWEARHYGQARG